MKIRQKLQAPDSFRASSFIFSNYADTFLSYRFESP